MEKFVTRGGPEIRVEASATATWLCSGYYGGGLGGSIFGPLNNTRSLVTRLSSANPNSYSIEMILIQ
jgi:hypothetical protein